MGKTTEKGMLDVAKHCVELAKTQGAKDAAARAYKSRQVDLTWRDAKVDKITESTTRGVTIQLYVDDRYSIVSTSDLRPEALKTFISDSIVLAKSLAKDPNRALPDPELYKGQASVDLKLEDPKYGEVTADARTKAAKSMEAAARAVKGSEALLSVETNVADTLNESFLVTSNGFSGSRRDTVFYASASASVKDKDGRRPEDYAFAGARFVGELPEVSGIGREAVERALGRLGSKKGESAAMPMVLDPRAGGRMVGFLLAALSGASLQQKRSFFEGKLGQQVANERMTLTDDPLIPKAFGSRLFDNEGIAAKARPVIEAGVLKNYFIDNYYGRKLGMKPTSAGASNLVWKTGDKNRDGLVADVPDGILVTSFLGGNSNSLTGDFSLGVAGFRIRGGKLAEPVAEMNISGNHLEFWKKLAAVGNDPYPYSSLRTPTLVFDGVSFAGA